MGKTTLVKLQIRDFLKRGISPWNILYYSLDLANTPQDIVDIIEIYLKISEKRRGNKRAYLFLDEASSVKDWQKGIKWLVDADMLVNCTVMVTGSQALNIRNATERLPGRKGDIEDNHDKILTPMKFSEYASLLDSEIKEFVAQNNLTSSQNRNVLLRKLLSGEVDERIDRLNAYQNELNAMLERYMLTGGAPKIINEYVKSGIIRENLYSRYVEGITGQWAELSKNQVLLKQFCGAIIKNQGSHTSWNNLARQSSIGSSNTTQDYAYTLRDLVVLSIVHLYDPDKKIPVIQKDKKIYLHDPFFLHIFNGWMDQTGNFETSIKYVEDEINQGRIIEGMVADHLIRWAFSISRKKQMFDYYNHVFYWKDDGGREVDFVLYDGDRIEVPIEVKYRNSLNLKELAPVVGFLNATGRKKGLVISKSDLDVRADYVIVPAAVFLSLI